MKYICWDESGVEVEIEAESAEDAAMDYVEGGGWNDFDKTFWVKVWVRRGDLDDEGEPEQYKVPVSPTGPKCSEAEHEWEEAPPGPIGNGGGIIWTEVCKHCEVRRTYNTWDFDRADGEQGLTSIRYHFDEED